MKTSNLLSRKVDFRMPIPDYAGLEVIAAAEGRSVGDVIRRLLTWAMGERNKESVQLVGLLDGRIRATMTLQHDGSDWWGYLWDNPGDPATAPLDRFEVTRDDAAKWLKQVGCDRVIFC